MNQLLETLVASIIFILPAYVANAFPVVLAALVKKRHPMDFGLKLPDGMRVLGDSKSWEGFLSGIFMGTLTGIILHKPTSGFTLSFGAMVGDTLGSFIKRRVKIETGHPLPILDQLAFLSGALTFSKLIEGVPDLDVALTLIIITPPIHLATNCMAYLLGLKSKSY